MAYIEGKNVVLSANITGLVDIDTEYNPESENPQSGIAVAQAVAEAAGSSDVNIVSLDTDTTHADNDIYNANDVNSVIIETNNALNNSDKTIVLDFSEDGYLNSNASLQADTKFKRTDYTEISGFTNIEVYAKINALGYAIAYFDADKTFISGTKGSNANAYTVYTDVIPSNAVYVMCSTITGEEYGFLHYENSISRIALGTIREENIVALNLEATYNDNEIYNANDINAVAGRLDSALKNADERIELDFNTTGYFNSSKVFTDGDNFKRTDYTEINGKTHITVNAKLNKFGYVVAFFDTDKTFISGVTGLNGSAYAIYTETVPANAKYVICSTITGEEYGVMFYDNSIDRLSETMKTKYNSVDVFNDIVKTFKKVGVIGDSLSVGYIYDTESGVASRRTLEYSWVHFAGNECNSNWVNYGESGVTTETWWTNENCYPLFEADNCQAYIIGLGVNDSSGSVELGTAADIDYTNGIFAETYYGNYAKIINAIHTKNDKAKIFLLTMAEPIKRKDNEYNVAIRNIAEISADLNVYLVDLADTYSDVIENSISQDDYIGAHFTAIGYESLAKCNIHCISSVMKDNYADFQNIHLIPYTE